MPPFEMPQSHIEIEVKEGKSSRCQLRTYILTKICTYSTITTCKYLVCIPYYHDT